MEEPRPAVKRAARKRSSKVAQPIPAAVRRVDSSTQKTTLYPWRQTLALLTALAKDRGRDRDADLARQALYIGSLFICIQDGPNADGLYGGMFTPAQVADQIRASVVLGADWLAKQGQPISSGGNLGVLLELLGQHQAQLPARSPEAFEPDYSEEDLAEADEIYVSAGMEMGLGEEDLAPL